MLDPDVRHFDAYYAFVDPDHVAEARAANGLGQYFVYDRGDKLDWNHPNRAGHRAIANYLASQGIFGPRHDAPGASETTQASR